MTGARATLAIHDPPYNLASFERRSIDEFVDWARQWVRASESALDAHASLYVWLGADQTDGFQPLPDLLLIQLDHRTRWTARVAVRKRSSDAMERLRKDLDSLLTRLSNEREVRDRLESLVSVYPFNEYEYIIANLLAMDVQDLDAYQELRDDYIARNLYLYVFEISAPRNFGETWAQGHLKGLVPVLKKPTKRIDPDYSGQYDFLLDDIRIEVKASRAVDADLEEPLYVKALASTSKKSFWMNFQQVKPGCCDLFVWIAVWRDVIRYWVLASHEVETDRHYSTGQHRGNTGEGQIHIRQANIEDFRAYEVQPNLLEDAIRAAYRRQIEAKR